MSFLFEDLSTVGGHVTALDINGQGSVAFLRPGESLRIKGRYVAQNPKDHPTRTLQIVLFLDGRFFKCVYNDVPPAEPKAEEGTFSLSCRAPEQVGRYLIRAGWGYNWPWPEDAYKYLLAYPGGLDVVGEFSVGLFAPEKALNAVPFLILTIPGVVMLLGGRRK